ncbi:uncharacterized protein [Musca autumnalis]|uniref:uncharacterized protein n=1 Tax=Musca autumnalis TaxID=221902 RepID=UPI003CF72073
MSQSKIYLKFKKLAALFLDFEKEYFAIPSSEHTMFTVELRQEEFKGLWSKVRAAYEQFCVGCDGTIEEIEASSLFKQCREAYIVCAAQMGELSHTFLNQSVLTSTMPNTNQAPGSFESRIPDHRLRLPACTTEIFYGDYLSWPSFRDMFTAVYIDCKSITPVEKLFYLRQSTQGEALEIVKRSPLTNDGFENAWTNLKDRFENKRILVNSQLKILFNLAAVKNESAGEIKRLQRDVNNCITSLKLHQIDVESWDPIFVFLCSTKLPITTLSLWEQTVSNKTEISKWSDLDTFLTARFQSLETVFDLANSFDVRMPETFETQKLYSSNQGIKYSLKVNKKSSVVCSEEHSLKYCTSFLKMDTKHRFFVVKKNNLCIMCFGSSHLLKECRSSSSCSICRGKHHTLLHRESRQSNIDSNAEKDCSTSTSQQARHNSTSEGNIQNCFADTRSQTLLGTAIVTIVVNGVTCTARALIDSGSQATFITEKLQRRLNLSAKEVNANVSGLNGASAWSSVKKCKFVLKSPHNGDFEVGVSAHVLPRLTENLPSYSITFPDSFSLGIAPLADPKFGRSSQVDILIGGDIYPQILLDGVQRSISGSLVAQETIFGWVLTGPILESNSLVSCCTLVDSELFRGAKYSPQINRCKEKHGLDIRSVDKMPHLMGMGPSSSVSQSMKGPRSSDSYSRQGPRSSKVIVDNGSRWSKAKWNNYSKVVSQNGPSSSKEKTKSGPSSSNDIAKGEAHLSRGVYEMEPTSMPAVYRKRTSTNEDKTSLMMSNNGSCVKSQLVDSSLRRLH